MTEPELLLSALPSHDCAVSAELHRQDDYLADARMIMVSFE